jgi:hypothetical protein
MDIWDRVATQFSIKPTNQIEASVCLNARYKALDNFGWNLALAIPNSASDGWGQITSPDASIIQ